MVKQWNGARVISSAVAALVVAMLQVFSALNKVIVRDNFADVRGGGIFNGGMATLNNVIIGGTDEVDNPAGNTATNVSNNASGGDVFNDGTFTMNGSTVSNNTADGNGGGIANYASGSGGIATTNLNKTAIITGNIAEFYGGGIFNFAVFNGDVTLALNGKSSVSGNTANYDDDDGDDVYSGYGDGVGTATITKSKKADAGDCYDETIPGECEF